ncbi:pyruvate kinase, partial [Neisseria meningitidis]|uniref:pyruvate kinase n=1 Tax=Neisseria meningitidis TaxID=487 RepID=UPI000CB2F858
MTRNSHNTKIVAPRGPGSNNVERLEDRLRVGGLNVVRMNFNHGTPEFQQESAS